jgi:ABC transport system ATP-binding/permease protein
LTYQERHELEALPPRIETLEAEQAELYQAMSTPSFYQQGSAEIAQAKERLKSLEKELDEAYQRWETLEALNG